MGAMWRGACGGVGTLINSGDGRDDGLRF